MGANTEYAVLDMLEKQKLDQILNGGGGSGDFLVTISVDTSGEEPVYTADKTFAEISEAIEDGAVAYAKLGSAYLSMFLYMPTETVSFGTLMDGGSDGFMYGLAEIDSQDNVSVIQKPVGGGGSNELVVTFTMTAPPSGQNPPTMASDKTYAEIVEALENGMNVRGYADMYDTPTPFYVTAPDTYLNSVLFFAVSMAQDSTTISLMTIAIDSTDTVTLGQLYVTGRTTP